MKDNYRFYEVNGEEYKIGDWESSEFEKDFPTAKVNMSVNGENYLIDINERDEFMKDFAGSEVSYTNFGPTRKEERQARREERQNDGKTTFGETLGKSAAAAGVRTGKLALDLARAAWNTGVVGGAINFMTGKKFDEKLQDEDNRITQWSTKLGETADRLSREADPTGGEKGYVDLIKEGNIGQVAQKALASGIESLPMMLAAGSGWGMLLYGAGMAAGEYSDETRENPDIPSWKRAINSMGSAALEMAVEKIGGPLNDLGKAGKEITEDMAKEILETAVKEGSENIAKRIVKKLGTMVKQGAEEGVEEVVTSFGNDVLGTSLDLIDGDADYGIQAQWNQLKEQNPDASLADFAKEKGKEYMDAFIGGAVSGLEISTTTEGLGAGVNALRNNESRNIMQHAREVGSSMSYDDLYDTDSDVANAKTAVANSFADKDGNPTISNEFIESLSAEDAYALAGREDFSYQQRRAFGELAIAKAKSDALNGRLDTMRDERVATIRSRMEKASENGQIVTGMVDGRVVYVRGGKVNNREVSVDKHGGHGPLLVIDSVTGEEKVVNSKDITSASVLNAEETINGMVNFILNNEASDRQTARTTMSKRAKIAAVNEFIGKRMMINSENGIIEVEVTASPQSGKVLIKGKKGDLGGQAIKPMDADVFYDSIYRNENGEPIFVEKGEVETEEVEVPETPTAPETPEAPVAAGIAEDDDFRDFTGTILVDGAPLNVSVISQDGPSDTIVYEYEDENGNTRRASTTIGAFKTAVQQGAEYAPEAPVVPETPVAETPVAEEVPPTEETPTEEEAPVEEVELGPDDIDWDALFESDPEAYFVELQKQFGDGAIDMLTAVVEATQEELDGLNKNKGKTQKEIFANVTKKKELQNKIDILNRMIERLTATPAPETAPEVVPEPAPDTETVTETPPAEPVEEPAPVAETPKFETPEGGFIMEDGYIVNPIVIEMPGVEGESNKIYLAEHNGKWGVAQYAVMDNGNSSGSEKNGRVQKEVITYDTPEEAIVKALKYFDFYRKNFGNKQLTSAKIDAFMQWIKDTYLKDSGLDVPDVFVPVAPNPVDDPIKEAKKREKSLATQLKRIGIPHEQKQDMAFNAGKAVADMFATREEYEDYAEDATDFGEYNADFERGVDASFANRPQNPNDTPRKSVPLENEPKDEGDDSFDGKTNEEADESAEGHSDNDVSGRTDNGGNQEGGEGDAKEAQIRDSGSEADESVEGKYPARSGDVDWKILKDTFGFSHFLMPPSWTNVYNAIYDTMMEMAKILGISPKSIGHGGTLAWNTISDGVSEDTKGQYGPYVVNRRIAGGKIHLRNTDLVSMLHEWWHSLDNMLEWSGNDGTKNRYTSSVGVNTTSARPEVFAAINDIVKAIKKSGHIDRIKSMNMWDSDERYFKSKKEQTARAFQEYILNKFAERGIVIDNIERQDWDTQPTAEEMAVIAPAFDNLFKVLQEKEGKTPGTSILFQIEKELKQNDEVKQELGRLVADWIQQGGNFVVMDTEAMQKALEQEGLLQSAKRARRTIFNRDLSSTEKNRIQKYILTLPVDYAKDRPYLLMTRNYAYVFNTLPSRYEENTTQQPIGDGFEILHKVDIRQLSAEQKEELRRRYDNDEERRAINGWLQTVGDVIRGLPDSVSDTSDSRAGNRDANLDEGQDREQATSNGRDTGSLRDSGKVQKLETADGVIYGFVKDGVVYLDPTLLNPNTAIHEYTHLWDNALMQLNRPLWEKGKALMKQTSLWNEVINDPKYADIKDDEDLVASEVHSRLVGTKGAEKLNQLEQEAKAKGLSKGAKELSILGKLKEWLNEATQWLKDAFSGVWSKEDIDNVTLTDFLNMPLRDLANFKALPKTGEITNESGEVVADNNGKGRIQFSISTWENGGRDYLADWLSKDETLAEDEKADILARMDEFYDNAQKYTDVYVPFGTWSEAAVKYDKDGNPLMSVIKANGDYAMNLDFSLVCKKRRPLNTLLRELIRRNAFATYTLRERELAEINWILQDHGFEVACALCFVDSKRFRVTGVADVFATLYNNFVKALAPEGAQIAHFNYSNNPNVEAVEGGIDTMPDEQLNWKKFDALAKKYGPNTVEGKVARFLRENPSQRRLVDATDFIDSKGFEAVKEGNPALLSLYNSKKGTGGPKASFGDVQYLNDILKKDKAFDVDKAYSVGGVRLQSFSDFVPHMYFDYMQLFAELAAKKLPAHAYTKEVLFAKIFGMSGIKVNMSLVPSVVDGGIAPGLDANGNYTWADAVKDADGNVIQQAQSFPYDEAMAIQNAEGYSKNCGVIAVGISDEHIEKMLDDPNIPFIIPYHKSSLNAIVARMTNIDKYKDYTKVQNTRKADGSKLDKGTPDFNFNAYLREHDGATPQQAAQAYLGWCKENNYIPKFSQFAYHHNYYKLLQDFNTYDVTTGEYAPQGAVTMTFPTKESPFGDVETLIQQGLAEDAALEEKMETEMSQVADEVEARLKEIAKEPKVSKKKHAEQMAQLADERTAKIKEQSDATAEEYGDGILSRSGDITPEMDAEYIAAVERGDMETAQRMVNEAADKYLNEMLLSDDADEKGFKYHRGQAPTKTFKRYAVFNVSEDGARAAYAGNATPTPFGVWLDAQNLESYTSDMVQFDDGTFASYITGDTGADWKSKFSHESAESLGIKGKKFLLERGGKHSSDVPNFSQMNLKTNENGEKVQSAKDGALPHNKLIFEIEYGISEDGDLTEQVREHGRMMKGKNQGLAKIGPNQYYDFKTNPNAVGNWGIGGTFRITRLVPYEEIVSVTEQYKKDAIAEAERLYESGEISKKDRDARVKSAEAIQVQKWVGGYNPADSGLSVESVNEMVEKGEKMKLTDPVTYDDAGNVIPLSERFNPEKKDIRYRKSEAQNAAVDFLVGEPRLRAIENAVNEEASKLGVKVTYKTREQMPEGHKNDKGYYDTKTGEVVVCTENASSIADAIQTILHEAVAHKGLRQLMGDKFNEFINRVYESLDADTKAKVDALAESQYNGNKMVAMEEYMATLAENTDFKGNVWDKIKSIFENIINAILGRNDIKIGDNELRYILRASYNNMVNPRNMETVRGWAQDQMMREEYKINEATPDILSRTGIDPDEVARETAKAVYERIVNENWQEFQRQFQDAMQPVRIAIDAIQQETGNLPIEDYENFLLMFNQASSRSRVEIDEFSRRYYSPIIESINEIVNSIIEARGGNTGNKKERAYAYQEIMNYLIAKHGLERNKYYQSTKTRKLTEAEKAKAVSKAQKAYDDAVDAINAMELTDDERADMLAKAQEQFNAELEDIETREVPDMRDYSGLTSLFGFPPKKFKEAEEEAHRLVDDFEKMLGRVDDESGETVTPSEQIEKLWKSINDATSKTLRHSYESGMLSRQQYNDIKDMFKFYIPLRGFDETTAEDVYSYARFEGNRFNPAVHKAKGRTSVADDPIATIMNMAESEIAQGNKNRAKQALYNFLLNRAAGKAEQNSLMQVERVWYLVKKDALDNEYYEIAVPNRDAGETYEEFEERMKVLEAEEKAVKSKKGKLKIGMRFQKPANMNAHYVFLKVNGVEKAIYINGDPKAAQAINGEHKKQRGALAEKMGILNRFISSMFTNYSLEFTARNYFRDMFYSHINIDVKESDPAYRKKFRQNWRHNNLRSMVNMLKAYRAGEYEGRDLNEDEMAFVEFMRNGGQTGYTLINSVETHKKDLERAIANMQKGIEKGGVKDSTIFKFTLGSIELLNEASELVTRFAAFKTSRDMGRGINTSIADAKEVTVNFNTKGAQDGKGFMGMIAHYFGWSKYFFNASVQGVQNLKSMAEANKLKFGSVIGGMVATGFLMPVITSAIASLFGNDDEEYWNIPEYERQNNFCVPIGNGKYVKVPLPIGFREVYAIGDMVAGAAFNKKFTRDLSQVGTDIANKLASIILPINPLESTANGLSVWHTIAYAAAPSSAQFLIQNLTNTDWKGAPLQKEYTYNEDDPQWMKAFGSNPDWMKGLSKWCNEHINLDGDYKGLDWSPEMLDNTLSNVFGGIYSLVKKTGKSISMIWNEENRNLSNIPLSGVVLGSGIDNDDRFVTDAYYDMKEYYDSNVNYIKRMAKRFGYDLEDVFEKEKGKHHPKMNEIYSNENFDFMQEWYTGVKELDAINDKIKKLDKKIAAKETPTEQDMLKWSRLNDKYMTERRDFVNDMLELD